MKRIVSLFVSILTLLVSLPVQVYASYESTEYAAGYAYLVANGVEKCTINLMGMDEVCEYAGAQGSQSETVYCLFTYDEISDTTGCVTYSEDEYIRILKKVQSREDNYAQNSWMRLEITSTHLSGDNYKIMCEYRWLTNPVVRYTDVVAITFDSRVVPQENTGEAYLSYTNSDGRHTTITYSEDDIKYYQGGIYVAFDIPGWGNTDIYGLVSTNAKVNSLSGSAVSFNNWAYYAHKKNALSISFDVSFPGGMGFTITPETAFNVIDVGLLSTYTP